MGDSENCLPPSKKRGAGIQLTKDNPEADDDNYDLENGTFKRATDEVLATRKIIKARRTQPASAPSSNPFATIRLVPPPAPAAKEISSSVQTDTLQEEDCNNDKCGVSEANGTENGKNLSTEDTKLVETENQCEKTDDKAGKEESETTGTCEKTADETVGDDNNDAPVSSFWQLSSSQNAFNGLAGTGFDAPSFSYGTSALGSSSDSVFGFKSATQSFPSFDAGKTTNGYLYYDPSSMFNNFNNPAKSKSTIQEVPVETGEESERAVFTADAVLYEYLDGDWKERGKGKLKVNAQISDSQKARLVMRARGNYRLVLNASIFPEMNLTKMDRKSITFACINIAGDSNGGLATFALKFKDSSVAEEFRGVVTAHKVPKDNLVKTPENSPKASDVE